PMDVNGLSKEDAQSFRKRVEYEDSVLTARTNIVLTFNGLSAVAVGLSLPGATRLILAIIMVVINLLWIFHAWEANRFIGDLINKMRQSPESAPPDEAFRWKQVYHIGRHFGPTFFWGL